MYASVYDFVCIALLLPFVLGFCQFFCFLFFSIVFIACYHWWICFFVWLLSSFFFFITLKYFFLFLIITFYFNNCILFFFLSFFLPFILSHVDDRVLVLQLGVRPVPLRWESRVQDIGPPETSQLHATSDSKNLPEISTSTSRPRSTQRPASYSAGHPMPNN